MQIATQMIHYTSTRATTVSDRSFSFEQALFAGYLEDGGLAVPDHVPTVDMDTVRSWSKLSYVELCKRIIAMFVPDSEINQFVLHGK